MKYEKIVLAILITSTLVLFSGKDKQLRLGYARNNVASNIQRHQLLPNSK